MKIKGIIFGFDGLICDSESTELRACEKLYGEYDFTFTFDECQKTIGAVHNDETPLLLLKELGGDRIDLDAARKNMNRYHQELIEVEPLREGVLDYLEEASDLGLKIGLASNSPISWVGYHLGRLKIRHFFECI